ncbi:MAG: helix-turn-helix transcriptional regulator [Chitinophagaceae bacterium]
MRNANHSLFLVKNFPDSGSNEFTREEWVSQFHDSNVIIHCQGKDIYYPTHWGPLSMKCAFGGREYYQKNRCKYGVSDENFLLLNEGTEYSSYIEPGKKVESLTINFNMNYQADVARVVLSGHNKLLEDPFVKGERGFLVEEKLFNHNELVSPLVYKIRSLTKNFEVNTDPINEMLYLLLEAVLLSDIDLLKEKQHIQAAKLSTKHEIYRRLNEVKDYIDSCFNEDITLEGLSKIALMSPFHLLRQFRKNYHITPHQYLIGTRLDNAKRCMRNSSATLTDICFATGFKDISSFSRLFKSRFGISPQQYRVAIKK